MQIHNILHSSSLASGYAEARAQAPGIAELSTRLETEIAGNARFPAIEKPEQSEASTPQDKRTQRNSRATANNDNEQVADEREKSAKDTQEKQRLEEERQEVVELAARDREVRAHEQAHVAVGGRYAGAASYRYERGPDGVNYAISGEVPISTSKESTPEATVLKAQIIRRAALAPAEPSPQDRSVAARASALEVEARKEIAAVKQQQETEKAEANKETEQGKAEGDKQTEQTTAFGQRDTTAPSGISNESSTTPLPNPVLPGSIGGRLFQSISNSTLRTQEPGAILSQIA